MATHLANDILRKLHDDCSRTHCVVSLQKQDFKFINCRELQDKCQSVELFDAINFVKYALINIHTIRGMPTKLSVNPKERYYCGRFSDRWNDNIKWV